jgi:hypothetical protein
MWFDGEKVADLKSRTVVTLLQQLYALTKLNT